MFRRSLLLLLPVAAVATGCSSFSDSDAVARVDDVELTQDEFDAQLVELGVTESDVLPLDPVRAEITRWIQGQLLPNDEIAASYELGPDEAGIICFSVIVVDDEEAAESTIDQIQTGTSFIDAFSANNIDPSLTANGGVIPCLTSQDLTESADIPFVSAAAGLSADAPLVPAPILGIEGGEIAWVVLRFRPFDELEPTEVDQVAGAIDVGDRVLDADIFVDSRYGVFDPRTGQVVALG